MGEDEIIQKVTDIRKTNNDCWMRLLKLALKSSPEEARKIIKDITTNDKQVTEWLQRL